jgi:hypothetical protein
VTAKESNGQQDQAQRERHHSAVRSERVIITSGIVRAADGPPRRAMVSVTKPSVSAIILLSGVKG